MMKKKNIISPFILILILCVSGYSQTITTLKPDSSEGKDAIIFDINPNGNYGDRESITAYVWTYQGALALKRILIEFDLSSIPIDAIVEKVELSLFYNPTDPYESFDTHSGQNKVLIQRITSSWKEDEVTWNNQPTTNGVEEVTLPESTSPTQNYLDIDVTSLFVNTDSTLIESHGLLLKLAEEFNPYRSLLFASSDHSANSLHPELKITWKDAIITSNHEIVSTNKRTIKLFPNPANGLFEFDITDEKESIFDIEIVNMHGQQIPFSILNGNQIIIGQKGSFFTIFSHEGERLIKKIIVQ